MNDRDRYLAMTDEALRAECDVHNYKASGPGGQHRNKVSSAVRLVHRPSGVSAHCDDSRSQHTNRRTACSRLRMNIACSLRQDIDISAERAEIPAVVKECMFNPRGRDAGVKRKLKVGRRDRRFWPVAAYALDVLDACGGSFAEAARYIGISTANLVAFLKTHRHLIAAVQQIRSSHGQKPMI
ncbi:MAG: peptide chain release factor-like protein [Planctomycetes bacterium]|nr:peptide chain release factor-like protein [Planctomycetota bacterium]